MQETWSWWLPEFKEAGQHEDAADAGTGATRATAHLPGLDIEITHRHAVEGDAEHIAINLKAVPSFAAFAHAFEAANPFALWMRGVELAWRPWLAATRAMALPWTQAPSLAPPDADAGSERQDNPRG
ncbi:MAG: hypothetical protein K2Y27_02785 [Xanthobacteraceae bacterium]|nr:hypothetical protein [Xanthobacteraceae bacterium]